MTDIAVIVAAGQGARLGGVAKALLPLGAETFLQAILRTAQAAGVTSAVVVVAEPFAAEVAAHARACGATVVRNPAPQRGMASSIALGFAALSHSPATMTGAWLWPVDHAWVSAATLHNVRAAATGFDAAIP
ncbi:MAG: NTP transferase domain-containing protein, partial [Kofleriaceae bacterium]|nr:NTP transferase domain-containing protein [Kofleriaceae bacterium]